MSFELSQTIRGHERGVRSVCVLEDDVLVTGGEDGTSIIWMKEGDNNVYVEGSKSVNHQGKMVFDVSAGLDSTFFSAGGDFSVAHCDISGSPITTYVGHQNTVNCVRQVGSKLLTGSWDGSVKLWNVEDASCERTYQIGQYATCLVAVPNTSRFITAGADMKLRIFDMQGDACLHEQDSGHSQIVRGLVFTSEGLVSVANDGTGRLFALNDVSGFAFVREFKSGTFVFSAVELANKQIAFASEDGLVRIFDLTTGEEKQTLVHSKTVFDLAVLSNGDLVTACEDRVLRIFSAATERHMSLADRTKDRESAEAAQLDAQAKGAREIDVSKLDDFSIQHTIRGSKTGQIKMFRQGEKATVCQWNGVRWDVIGEAMGSSGDGGMVNGSKQYVGDILFTSGEYDIIFDVEVGPGGGYKKLPWRRGDNPLVVAEKFCAREQIGKMHVPDIVKFINDGTRHLTAAAPTSPPPTTQPGAKVTANSPTVAAPVLRPSVNDPKHFPLHAYLSFPWTAKAVSAACEKIKEASALLPEGTEGKLDGNDLRYLLDLATKMSNESWMRGDTLRQCETDLLHRRWASWYAPRHDGTTLAQKYALPSAAAIAGLDMLRMLALQGQSAQLHKASDGGWWLIGRALALLKEDQGNGALSTVALRYLANMFEVLTNRTVMARRAGLIVQAIEPWIVGSTNKNARVAAATLLLNLAQALLEQGGKAGCDPMGRVSVASLALQLLSTEDDGEAAYRLLVAFGVLLHAADYEDGDAIRRLVKPQKIAGGLKESVNADPRILEILSEVQTAWNRAKHYDDGGKF